MEEQFVTYDIAFKLKQLGFNEQCLAKYCRYNPCDPITLFPHSQDFFDGYFSGCDNESCNNDEGIKITAPLWQQAIAWLREKHDIHIEILYDSDWETYGCIVGKLSDISLLRSDNQIENDFDDFDDARTSAIEQAIEILKK